MTPKTYSTTEINALAGTGWCYWRLRYLVQTGVVIPLNRGRGKERRFSEAEGLKAINILRASIKRHNLEQLAK